MRIALGPDSSSFRVYFDALLEYERLLDKEAPDWVQRNNAEGVLVDVTMQMLRILRELEQDFLADQLHRVMYKACLQLLTRQPYAGDSQHAAAHRKLVKPAPKKTRAYPDSPRCKPIRLLVEYAED